MTEPTFALALQHHQAGRLADAEALYRQILAAEPNHAEALHYLGVIAHQAARHDTAIALIRKAIALSPTNPAAHSNLGEAYRATGRLDEAAAAYQRALQIDPHHAEACNNLGLVLAGQGRMEEAVTAYGRAVQINPGYAEAYSNLGVALAGQGRVDEALAAYRQALQLKPDLPETYNNLGIALSSRGQLDEAMAACRRALLLKPNYSQASNNLGNILKRGGQLEEAVAAFRRALELKPDSWQAQSNLIYTLHFLPGLEESVIAGEQRQWSRKFGDPLKRFGKPHANNRNPERRLRIGYVSPDFRDHVIGRNLVPLFEHHDPRDFEIVCYSNVFQPDHLTEEFRRRAPLWRNTIGVTDEALAEMIRQDGIDILVDLTQHMADNRLPVFARQPAPVQVSFAGYPESTGLKAIGYRISDRYLEEGYSRPSSPSSPCSPSTPPGSAEQIFFLESFWCYDPCGIELTANRLPAQENGIVAFGSLNNFCKINVPVLKLWARVLQNVSDSQLLLLSPAGSHRQRALDILQREGVGAHRVDFVEPSERRAYLELYHRLDIVLDPFPYNGHTTSLDALWMGIPVVSLAGRSAVSRAGLSALTNAGLPELVASSEDDYVGIAARLAHDLPRLAELRRTLRSRMQASPLMDAPRFARNIEAAYRSMWQRWCAEKQS